MKNRPSENSIIICATATKTKTKHREPSEHGGKWWKLQVTGHIYSGEKSHLYTCTTQRMPGHEQKPWIIIIRMSGAFVFCSLLTLPLFLDELVMLSGRPGIGKWQINMQKAYAIKGKWSATTEKLAIATMYDEWRKKRNVRIIPILKTIAAPYNVR